MALNVNLVVEEQQELGGDKNKSNFPAFNDDSLKKCR
jgi:hypothetical protein